MGYIYILTSPNGKSYIGQTIHSIEKIFEQHQKRSRCRRIYNAIKKYGWENIEKDWYYCPDEDLNNHEELMVEVLGTLSPDGYNLREGGGSRGKASKESKQKMRKPKSDEHKQSIRKARLGTTRSEESKQKHRKAQLGKKQSKETIQKRREANSGEKHPMSKRVYQYDLDGIFINSFGSVEEAGRYIKKDATGIKLCARYKRKTAHKFKWSYNMDIFM